MSYKLSDVASYISVKISTDTITLQDYISTENMLPEKAGIIIASSLPSTPRTNSFQSGDTLFSNIRTYFRKVWFATFDGGVSSDVLVLRSLNTDVLFGKYLYYVLSNEAFIQHTITTAKGTKMPRGDKSAIMNYEFELPPLPTQKKIAHILSTLDDKIELNRKMNDTLEAMAQALFKSWFVDFDPVHLKAKCTSEEELEARVKELGIAKEVLELFPSAFEESEMGMGMIPLGWEVSTIEDEVTIYGGATPSTKEEKYWIDGDNHWATPRDLSGLNSKILIDTGRKITDDGVNKISSKQLPIGTVLLSSRAPIGYIAYSTVPISINQGFIAMVCKKRLSNYFIMYWLDIAMNEIKTRAIGTTFSEISKSAFRPIKLVVASDEVIISFDAIVAPMVKKLIENEREIETLQQTRDILLPKLLSGELDVSEIEYSQEHLSDMDVGDILSKETT